MLATQYDDEVDATLPWAVALEVSGTASTGEVETERMRTRRVRNKAAAEKVTITTKVVVVKRWWWLLLLRIEMKDL